MSIKIIHLKTGERKPILSANIEHRTISDACCENKHRFGINMDTGHTDIDNHADTHFLGNNFRHLR